MQSFVVNSFFLIFIVVYILVLVVVFFSFFVLLDVLCTLVCSILVLCIICAAEMANKDTHNVCFYSLCFSVAL